MSNLDQPYFPYQQHPAAPPLPASQWQQPQQWPQPQPSQHWPQPQTPPPAYGAGWGQPQYPAAPLSQRTVRPAAAGHWAAPAALVVGGLLLVVGSVTPWVTASVGSLSATATGVSRGAGDGWLTLTLGVLLAASGAGLWARRGNKGLSVTSAVVATLAVILCAYEVIHLFTDKVKAVGAGGATVNASISIGFGLVMASLAAVVALGGAFAALSASRAPAPR